MSGSCGFSRVWVRGVRYLEGFEAGRMVTGSPWGRGVRTVLGRGSPQVGLGALPSCCVAASPGLEVETLHLSCIGQGYWKSTPDGGERKDGNQG